jgi:hypothetical protein
VPAGLKEKVQRLTSFSLLWLPLKKKTETKKKQNSSQTRVWAPQVKFIILPLVGTQEEVLMWTSNRFSG